MRLLFIGGTGVISSAAACEKPPKHYLITEDTPLGNPCWEYDRCKVVWE